MRNIIKKYQPDASTFYWDKYRGAHGNKYVWSKYDIKNVNTYEWKKYNTNTDTFNRYEFKKYYTTMGYTTKYAQYSKSTRTNHQEYKWDKYTYIPKDTILNYTWDKSNPAYTWNKYEKLTYPSGMPKYTLDTDNSEMYCPTNFIFGNHKVLFTHPYDSTTRTRYYDNGDELVYIDEPNPNDKQAVYPSGSSEPSYAVPYYDPAAAGDEESNWLPLLTYNITDADKNSISENLYYPPNHWYYGFNSPNMWQVWVKYYDSITIDPDTGEKIYGNCYQQNGVDYVNKFCVPKYNLDIRYRWSSALLGPTNSFCGNEASWQRGHYNSGWDKDTYSNPAQDFTDLWQKSNNTYLSIQDGKYYQSGTAYTDPPETGAYYKRSKTILMSGSIDKTEAQNTYALFQDYQNQGILNYPYMEISLVRFSATHKQNDWEILQNISFTPMNADIVSSCVIKTLNHDGMYQTDGITPGNPYLSPSAWLIGLSADYDTLTEEIDNPGDPPRTFRCLKTVKVSITNVEKIPIKYNGEPGAAYPGSLLGQVTSTDPNAYPDDGADGDYYYIATGIGAGTYIETVTAGPNEPNKYPTNGLQDGYYYSNKSTNRQPNDEKQTFLEQVGSVSKNAYPINGVQAGYWYQFVGGTNEEEVRYVNYMPSYATYEEANAAEDSGKALSFRDSIINLYVLTNPNKQFPDIVNDNGVLKWTLQSSDYTLYTTSPTNIVSLLDSDGSIDGYSKFLVGTPNNNPICYQLNVSQSPTVDSPISSIHTFSNDVPFLFNASSWTCGRTNNRIIEEPIQFETLTRSNTNEEKYYVVAYNYTDLIKDTARTPTTIEAINITDYPLDGWVEEDGVKYWYVYTRTRTYITIEKGSYIGIVTSQNQNAYPDDSHQDMYWYVFQNIIVTQEQGNNLYDSHIISNNISDYPDNGIQDGYWYVRTGQEDMYYNTNYFLGTVSSTNPNEYPLDGYVIVTENNEEIIYWYVRWSDEEGYTPVWNDHNLLHGVTYKQNVNPDEDYIIGAVATASIEFMTNDITSTNTTDGYKYYNTEKITSVKQRQIGIFNIVDVENQGGGVYKVTMYDNISKFDDYVDSWIEQQTYPVALKTFFANLCNHFNVEYVAIDTMTNANFMVYDNFRAINISGKQILGYIAEAVGGFACANADGKIEIRTFTNKSISINNHKYVDYKRENYSTAKINKLVIQTTANDVGVVATRALGTEQYNIINNPLFYTDDETLNRTAANALISQLNRVQYVPGEVTLLEDPDIKCGDIITVNGNTFYVMEKELNESGVTLSCFGNRNRLSSNSSVNSDIIALRGKTNELTRTLEQTQSTITDISAGLQSQVTQTADSFNVEIGKLNQEITSIHAGLDGIKLSYNYNDQTASLTIGTVTIRNLVGTDYVDQVVAGIDMTGYVQFNDLARTGSTVINGSNITTGTIAANRINLTGAITWSDLSNDTKNTIYSLVSTPSGDTVPSYIHSTYIDSTTIYSPTIYGAEIYAGTSAQGYMKLSSSGINYYSNVGGAIFGVGYYAGKYNYPYITLGQGVDSIGTDKGLIKKFANGIWIGDSDCITDNIAGKGVGIFINFNSGTIWKAENGVWTQL